LKGGRRKKEMPKAEKIMGCWSIFAAKVTSDLRFKNSDWSAITPMKQEQKRVSYCICQYRYTTKSGIIRDD
jgi:hypothetical protein